MRKQEDGAFGNGKLRVAIVTWFPEDIADPCGGVETVSTHLLKALAAYDDLDLHVVTTKPGFRAGNESVVDGIHVHRLPWPGGSMFRSAIGSGRQHIQAYLRRLRPDLVHAHDTFGPMVQGLRIPRVFTIHGFIHEDLLISKGRLRWLRYYLWRRIETAAWADQPHIIAISPYVRERLRGIARGVIHDIDNPIGEELFRVERHEQPMRLFSGAALCERKNTLGLLAGFARLRAMGFNAQLRLSGNLAEKAYVNRVHHFIRDHELSDSVHLLGRVGYRQILDELAAASIFVLVSWEENSPMGIEEAMAAGVPVVTSNRCGMPYMVRDGESGFLVDPNDPEDVAQRLAQILRDDHLRARMGAKGREIALDRFHPEKVARRTREVYLRAMRDYQRTQSG